MSIFKTADVPCPDCRAIVRFDLVASVNADRRPDLTDAVIADSLQRQACSRCGKEFRAPPRLTYVDLERRLWVIAYSATNLEAWERLAQSATATFERAYGASAPAFAQEIGRSLKTRLVFGWPALKEKVLCAAHGLDDVALELLKVAVLRDVPGAALSDKNEMRLVRVGDEALKLIWVNAETEVAIASLEAPRSAYDEIAADETEWDALRAALAASPFLDYTRLLVA
jgi:CpXC protein